MRMIASAGTLILAAGLALILRLGAPAEAHPSLTAAIAPSALGVPHATVVQYRWYRTYDDDGYYTYVPPADYAPRVYGYLKRYGEGIPPSTAYPPPDFYEWVPPPRPASCGKYRYWNGEYCADARFRPPYVGPRW